MSLSDLKKQIEGEVNTISSSDFTVHIKDIDEVPVVDHPHLTFPDLKNNQIKCLRLETCVLFIDLRKSTDLNLSKRPYTLSKVYSAFIQSMAKAAHYFGGKVRNIIGDRLMVVFDKADCFKNAVNTAFAMNTIAKYVLNKKFSDTLECGIGIDYGKMLITKTGVIKRGTENQDNKALVWLGRPANIASKLTDLAKKKDKYGFTVPPILVTERVYEGFKKACPDCNSIKENYWEECLFLDFNYDVSVYGGDIIYPSMK